MTDHYGGMLADREEALAPPIPSRSRPRTRADRWVRWAPYLVALVLTIAVFGPWLRGGVVLLLDYGDYPAGPRPRYPLSIWGFPPGLTSRSPVNAALTFAFQHLPWGWVRSLPLLLVPLVVTLGFSRLFPGNALRASIATVAYVVNPFVQERMSAGQIYIVLGYALLPMLLALLASGSARRSRAIATSLLLALQIALAPHFLFVSGLLLLGFLVHGLLARDKARVRFLLAAMVTTGLLSAYWILPAVTLSSQLQQVDASHLTEFRTRADPRFGLVMNVLGLYGFWRPETTLAKHVLSGWPLLLAGILAIAAFGLRGNNGPAKRLRLSLSLAAVAAFLLVMGDRGPTGPLFTWAFFQVPGFRVMREPQKFAAIMALCYAVFYAAGAERIALAARSAASKRFLVFVAALLPCIYGFTLFWGFGGHVRPSRLPTSWAEADRLMGRGPERVLALPWHHYLSFPFTDGRVVSNPMGSAFRRETIAGDNLELGELESPAATRRSRYLEFLIGRGGRVRRFGNLVAPLGVRYVLVAKVADWRRYGWLYEQQDLKLVREWADLALFENLEDVEIVYSPKETLRVESWDELLTVAETRRLVDYFIAVGRPRPAAGDGPVAPPSLAVPFDRPSPARYELGRSPPSGMIVLAEPFHPSWRIVGTKAMPNAGVTTAFMGVNGGRVVEFERWRLVRASYAASLAVLMSLAAALIVERLRGRAR